MTAFEARYPGHCHACDERITPGELVLFNDAEEIIHAVCFADEPNQAIANVCDKCWTDHAGECL